MNDIDKLTDTVDRFCRFIAALPAEALAEQDWGPKEVLAHLAYHHALYVRLAEAWLAGAPPNPPRGRYREINAAAAAASRGVAPLELAERLQQANRRLAEIYRQSDPQKIMIEIKAGAKQWPLVELVPAVEAHIRNHLEKLRREFKPGSRSF